MAVGCARMTRLPKTEGHSRQAARRRRFSRFRATAVPSDLRITKMTPEHSRPERIQRLSPRIQPTCVLAAGSQTARRFRPRRRRRARMARPPGVRIRRRNPCLLRRFRLLGWKVRFTRHLPMRRRLYGVYRPKLFKVGADVSPVNRQLDRTTSDDSAQSRDYRVFDVLTRARCLHNIAASPTKLFPDDVTRNP